MIFFNKKIKPGAGTGAFPPFWNNSSISLILI